MGKVRSKLDGGDSEQSRPPPPPPRPVNNQPSRYDADPRLLNDDFSNMNLQDPTAPTRSHRPLANPDLFKSSRFTNSDDSAVPPPKPPRPGADANPSANLGQSLSQGPAVTKKWEPLRPAEDRDPFALGDSDDDEGRDGLYGAPSKQTEMAETGKQEQGIVPTPLDPAIDGPGTKPSS